MTGETVRKLLSLLNAVTQDGGEAVVRALANVLSEAAPFDEGELVLTLVADLHRRPFGDERGPLVAEDVIGALMASGDALRLDHPSEAANFPKTRELLAQRQLQSLLALPVSPGGVVRGAVVLVSRRPCAFAGAPLQSLTPLACAAGIALTHALKLTGLHDEQERLKEELHSQRDALARAGRAAAAGEASLEALRASRAAARHALDERRIRHEGDVTAAREEAARLGAESEALRQALAATERQDAALRAQIEALERQLAEEGERSRENGAAASDTARAWEAGDPPDKAEGDTAGRRGRRRARP